MKFIKYVYVNGKLSPFQQINGFFVKRIEDKEQDPQASFEAKIKIKRVHIDVDAKSNVKIKAEVMDNNKPFRLTFLSPLEAAWFFLENDLIDKVMRVGGQILSKTEFKEYVAELLINKEALLN